MIKDLLCIEKQEKHEMIALKLRSVNNSIENLNEVMDSKLKYLIDTNNIGTYDELAGNVDGISLDIGNKIGGFDLLKCLDEDIATLDIDTIKSKLEPFIDNFAASLAGSFEKPEHIPYFNLLGKLDSLIISTDYKQLLGDFNKMYNCIVENCGENNIDTISKKLKLEGSALNTNKSAEHNVLLLNYNRFTNNKNKIKSKIEPIMLNKLSSLKF